MSKESAIENLNFEDSLKELEEIVERLENGQGSLDDAIAAYERGSMLKKHCQAKLDEARLKVEKIKLPQDEGGAKVIDFDE
tara:strand:- start:647 stop:889 length:243 start_codon:yes stop_codon:yes gene_type:complete